MKALAHREVHALCRPLVIGDARRLGAPAAIVGLALAVRAIARARARRVSARHRRLHRSRARARGPAVRRDLGRVAGEAAFRFIERAVALALAGEVEAICTAPLNKEALHAAGHRFPGHTELLAQLTGTAEVSMMLMAPRLRVIHVTTHIGLLDAIERIDAASSSA